MMVRTMFLGIVALAALVAGCEPLNTPNDGELSSADIAELRQMILSDPLYTNDAAVLNDGDDAPSFSTLGKAATPIIPLHWGRRIASVAREMTFEQVDDTTVIATVTHKLEGTIFIVAKYSNSDTARTIIQKPLSEQTQRRIKFYRAARSDAPNSNGNVRRGWRPAEVSASQGGTQNAQLAITKLELTAGDRTIEITEPLEYFLELQGNGRHKIRPVIFNVGTRQPLTVRLTLVSADPDTDWVSIHRPLALMNPNRPDLVKPMHERMVLVSQTPSGANFERVYEATWETFVQGRHAFFVTAVTRSSIFDDQAAFSSQVWGVPYITE